MGRSLILSAAIAALPALVPAAAVHAHGVDFHVEEQNVTVDSSAGTANFSVTFNRAPLFVDPQTGHADAFQYEIDADIHDTAASFGVADVDAVVRGGEIWLGDGLPLRAATGDGGENAGGWGPVRTILPFELNDRTVTFSAPLEALDAEDETFRYRAFAIAHGEASTPVIGAVIPIPAAFAPGLTLLGGLMALRAMRKTIV